MKRVAAMTSPLGVLRLTEDAGFLVSLDRAAPAFCPADGRPLPDASAPGPLLQEARDQLRAYFAGRLRRFDLPLAPQGTPFQQRVWRALQDIPYGRTCSYRELAAAVGNARACRAVGRANGRNPLMIVIPCHRVIAADGGLGGYSGGLDCKRFLLALERGALSGSGTEPDAGGKTGPVVASCCK